MATIGTLAVNVIANTKKMNRSLGKLQRRLKRFAGQISLIGGGLSFITATRSLISFDNAMQKSLAIMGDLSDTMRNDLRKEVINVAGDFNLAFDSVADSIFSLASIGLTAEQSLKALSVAGAFARAGSFEMAKATELLTDAQNAFGLVVEDSTQNMLNMTRVSDVLVKANILGAASVEEFGAAAGKVASAARNLGLGIEEVVGSLVRLAKANLKGDVAGTALEAILRELPDRALENADAFAQLGIRVFDSGKKFRGLANIIADFENSLEGLSDAEKIASLNTLGLGAQAQSVLLKLAGGSADIAKFTNALREAGGTALEVANKNMTPLSKALGQIRKQFMFLLDTMTPMLDMFSIFIAMASQMLKKINSMVAPLTNLGKSFSLMAPGIGKNVVKLMAFVGGLSAGLILIPKIAFGLTLLVTSIKNMTKALAAAQSITVVGALSAAVGIAAGVAAAAGVDAAFKDIEKGMVEVESRAKQLSQPSQELTNVFKDLTEQIDGTSSALVKTNGLMETGRQLTQQFRSPIEIFTDRWAELNEHVKAGAINWITYGRAVKDAQEQLDSATKSKNLFNRTRTNVAGVARGTTAAFVAVQNARAAGERLASKQLSEQKQQTELQKLIEENTRKQGHNVNIASI